MKNKYIKIIIVIFISFLVSFLLYFFINDNRNIKIFKNLMANTSKLIYYPFYNKKSNKKIISKSILENEIKDLKKEINLKKTLTDKKVISAQTIKRSTSYFYNTITINKGKKSNIKKGNMVINSSGFLGNVINVSKTSSEVKLISSKKKNNFFSAMFMYNDNPVYGLIDDYNITKNELHLKNVIGDFSNIKNVKVYTSGLSKNNVKGILIGTIKHFNKTNYGIENDIYITPSANFNNINYVEVLVN